MELKLTAVTDFLNEQEWFQQLKTKWEELDLQSRLYLKIAGSGAAVLLFVYLVLSSIWSVHKLNRELAEKSDLLMTIQNANDEMRRLRDTGAPPSTEGGPWQGYFETVAGNSGIDKSILTISSEKQAAGGDTAKEALYDLSLKKATIRQVVKFSYNLENGNRPVKVRHISIDTGADPSGYLDATLSVSAFTVAEPKAGK